VGDLVRAPKLQNDLANILVRLVESSRRRSRHVDLAASNFNRLVKGFFEHFFGLLFR